MHSPNLALAFVACRCRKYQTLMKFVLAETGLWDNCIQNFIRADLHQIILSGGLFLRTMNHYSKLIVPNQMEEFISIQGVNADELFLSVFSWRHTFTVLAMMLLLVIDLHLNDPTIFNLIIIL